MLLTLIKLFGARYASEINHDIDSLIGPTILEMKDVYHLPLDIRYEFLNKIDVRTYSEFRAPTVKRQLAIKIESDQSIETLEALAQYKFS